MSSTDASLLSWLSTFAPAKSFSKLRSAAVASVLREQEAVIGISLNKAGLTEVPSEIRQIPTLRALCLAGNALSDLPDWLPELSLLERLYCPSNTLTVFPQAIPHLRSLAILNLRGNAIQAVPDNISDLQSLQYLDLAGNRLTALPSTLRDLTKLRTLLLAENPLDDLPHGPKKLYDLNVARTRLASLPTWLLSEAELRSLDLTGTPISALSDEVTRFAKLRFLDVSETPIEQLPENLGRLSLLRTLRLRDTMVSSLPASTATLKVLMSIDMARSHVRDLSLLANLKTLRTISARACGIQEFPEALLSLPLLRQLDLSENAMRELPPSVATTKLPIVIAEGRAADGIILYGNPITVPPPEIVSKGNAAIGAYFRSTPTKRINEVKVLLVGDGGAGKTSLVKRLLGKKFDRNEPQTHGIKIDDGTVVVGAERITAHFWDFGGQEMMHATHQFFLSKRSAYMLVLDGRKEEKTEYWLKHIETFGGTSPVLVVLNKVDEHSGFDVNRRFLREKYPNIIGFIRVSCATNEGIDKLRDTLPELLSGVEVFRTVWSQEWFNVKQQLEKMTADYISVETFIKMCATENIDDRDAQETLISFLHDLGIALRFTDLPLRDTNVINPRWVTEGVYRIITDDRVAKAGGVLRLELLAKLLDKKRHPVEKHNFLIELMKKFELCYALSADTVLLPGLLPIEEPGGLEVEEPAARFVVDYEFLPKSVMPRFIVRMSGDIHENLRWRTGVALFNRASGAHAVVRADEVDRQISIVVYGDNRREYLGILLHALREINDSFDNLQFNERVVIPDNPRFSISYRHLTNLESLGHAACFPEGADHEYDVSDLLGYVRPRQRTEDEILRIVRELRDGADTEDSMMQKINKAVMLQPNFFGLGFNLNNLIRKEFRKRS